MNDIKLDDVGRFPAKPEAKTNGAIPVVVAKKSAGEILQEKQAEKRNAELEFVRQFSDLDWKKLPPPLMAQLLTRIPRKGRTQEPDWYMTYEQGLAFAIRCFELGLSPLSDDVFFMRDTWKAGITTSGKRRLARVDGLNLSPPQMTRRTRPWVGRAQFGLAEDVGYECKMVVNNDSQNPATYMAWISEWGVSGSPVWQAKPEHMIQVRAYEKCLTFASGSGISQMPDEQELEPEETSVVEIVTK